MDYLELVEQFFPKKILFVTSFNKKIFDFTGINLIQSFIYNNDDDNIYLLATCEDFTFDIENKNLIKLSVMTEFLTKILKENEDVIPICYGGKATIINNPKLFNNKQKYNFQASRWFKKLAALEIAYTKFKDDYEYIIWIDSDCLFLNKFNYDILINPLKNNTIGYFYGPLRAHKNHGIETGLVFFHKKSFFIINKWYSLLINKKFIEVERWDDGYLLKYLLIDNKIKDTILSIDFAKDLAKLNPMDYGPYTNIIKHMKGIHQQNNITKKN